MGILRTAIIGAAVYGAYKYLTQPDAATGRTKMDDLKEQAPDWIENAKSKVAKFTEQFEGPQSGQSTQNF